MTVKVFLLGFYIYTFRTRLLLSGSPLHHIAVEFYSGHFHFYTEKFQ